MENRFLGSACGAEAERKLFAPFVVIAAPLPGAHAGSDREARVFGRVDEKPGTGCDYGSHVLALAVHNGILGSAYKGTRRLCILVSHGAGCEVWSVPSFYDGGDYERALLAMPERLQYAALYTMYRMASDARREAADSTAREYSLAFIEKRLKTKRRNNRKTVEIMPRLSLTPTPVTL